MNHLFISYRHESLRVYGKGAGPSEDGSRLRKATDPWKKS